MRVLRQHLARPRLVVRMRDHRCPSQRRERVIQCCLAERREVRAQVAGLHDARTAAGDDEMIAPQVERGTGGALVRRVLPAHVVPAHDADDVPVVPLLHGVADDVGEGLVDREVVGALGESLADVGQVGAAGAVPVEDHLIETLPGAEPLDLGVQLLGRVQPAPVRVVRPLRERREDQRAACAELVRHARRQDAAEEDRSVYLDAGPVDRPAGQVQVVHGDVAQVGLARDERLQRLDLADVAPPRRLS